jgi:hypothetical protein
MKKFREIETFLFERVASDFLGKLNFFPLYAKIDM